MKYETFPVGQMGTNCYLVYEGNDAVVIDAGGGFSEVYSRSLTLNLKIHAVLLTHGHFDHTMGAGEYMEKGIPLGISLKDEYMLSPHRDNLAKYFGIKWQELKADFNFKDGEILTFGELKLKALSTPGHTAGSFSFLCDYVCFSGDTLFLESVGRTDFPTGSHSSLLKSVREKLFVLPNETPVCPGHNEPTTIGHEKKFNPYLAEEQ